MTGRVFLNYRRADAEAWADRVFERLIRVFPRENVFMDIDGNIPFGFPWAKWLDQQVSACDLMLVLIGRSWIAEFQARSDPDQHDYVRVEIESALAREIPVVPVFLGDAPLPRASDLPESVRPLLTLQAARLQRGTFDLDADTLVKGVARSIALARGSAEPAPSQIRNEPPEVRYRAEGRIHVDAKFVHGAPDGWFLPGNGTNEWFKDFEGGPEMVVLPAGEFVMGSPANEPGRSADEGPQRTVTIAQPFAAGRTEVTFDEWDACVADGGCNDYLPDDNHWGRGARPVINVSREDAQAYAAWLSAKTGEPYRLLTEAEWEYAARAGRSGRWSFGDDESLLKEHAWYSKNSGGKTQPVGQMKPNAFGLHDMHGNVWEWVQDGWHTSYAGTPPNDGSEWIAGADGGRGVVRGGSWGSSPGFLRSACRVRDSTGNRDSLLGFRIGRTLEP